MIDKAELCTALATINPIKFSRLDFHALEKYVDHVFSASNKLPKGTRWNMESGAMEWSQEQAEKEDMDLDSRTMEEISKLAGSIFKCRRFTWDCLIKNHNLIIPVLDIQLWLWL